MSGMRILDTTVRDGSYAVDFKFSCEDVAEIVKKLEKLNMDYIEIGHGMGLNASFFTISATSSQLNLKSTA